ncbi:unnamed protein product [Soboliphyme baturini]|uniref:Rab proteins geranylgeranyltransferase component A n=1 Tax=Soboliphyme baturini TaxID=241478 RepID=A0A183IS19_9BILA|nr:unnamed protein product [Soboliphyme baturini]
MIIYKVKSKIEFITLFSGLPECLLSAACSRAGLSVLHLDRNSNYGGNWASFSFSNFVEWCEHDSRESLNHAGPQPTSEGVYDHQDVPLPDAGVQDRRLLDEILSNSRFFNLDLCPKVLFSRGSMVELMIRSNINNYAEFSNVDKILVHYDNQLRAVGISVVPCSRSDVFQCQEFSVVEKRLLMKFLTFCMSHENLLDQWIGIFCLTESFHSKPSSEHYHFFLPRLISKKFISSTGVYGSSPLLWTLYGSGELPQCFCRLCAVYGGVFCLRCRIDGWILSKERCNSLMNKSWQRMVLISA